MSCLGFDRCSPDFGKVKTWMDESLGATYSDRTYTKKIQATNRDFVRNTFFFHNECRISV